MSTTLDFLEGPLFRVALLLFALGFLRRGVLALLRRRAASAGDRPEVSPRSASSPLSRIATGATWVCIALLGIFLADHVVAWGGEGVLPVLPHGVADVFTILTMVVLVVAFGLRVYEHRPPHASATGRRHLALLWFCLLMGSFASHPGGAPIAWETALCLHVFSACLFLAASPFVRAALTAPGKTRGPVREHELEEVTA